MTTGTPPLDQRNADQVVTELEEALADYGWQGQMGGAGWALARLFGRLAELVINRLNQVPDKHFLAFLNQSGVDLLPPRSAGAELSFTPAADGPPCIRVPTGTQVATVQTEIQPEVIFETEREIVVAPNTLVRCIAFDPLAWSDRTAEATGKKPGTFAAFQGELERKRILYLSDDDLLAFEDEASRMVATITLSFTFSKPGDPEADGHWELEWLAWDGSDWIDMEAAGAVVEDNTDGFSTNRDVRLSSLPQIVETQEVDGESRIWIGCKLKGGTSRNYLPLISTIQGSRTITDLSGLTTGDVAFSALQSGTAFVDLDPSGEFFPLGQRPGRLDTFYLRADEPFTKSGASVSIMLDLVGVTETPIDTSQLESLEVQWAYHSTDGWNTLGSSGWNQTGGSASSSILGFEDMTNGFTKSGSGEAHYVKFTVPQQNSGHPLFAKTKVNDVKGYWIRAQMMRGSYDVPGRMEPISPGSDTERWVEPKTYPPLIRTLQVAYSGYREPTSAPKPMHRCRSQVDTMWQDHDLSLAPVQPFAPFSAAEEGPVLYLGFRPPFPSGEWNQLLLDVTEGQTDVTTRRPVFWEYWNGSRWTGLRVSDGTGGLNERGYLGFFGPRDHRESTEFGQKAYWLRARPQRAPSANAGTDQTISIADVETTVTLDASASEAFDRQTITQYTWRLVSSSPPTSDAGPDQTVTIQGEEATVTLDAGSQAAPGRPIVRYTWRLPVPTKKEDTQTIPMPYLKVILLNTVPALNAVTIKDEVLGSSDGKPDQIFTLLRSPVLLDAQIAVREPDRPPDEELEQLQKELQQSGETDQVSFILPEASPGGGVWVRWRLVQDFYTSNPASRHFTLDTITGQVHFGDGKRGKIPPVDRDNIKAVFYHTHDGAKGNAKAGSITVLRNPSGDLANIKQVYNPESAAGGSDAETVADVKRRGPQSLKNRQRAVTAEDYVGLALEASAEVAHVRCLPTRNSLGLKEAGWVTVVITPKSTAAKPTPSPALLRLVQNYLEGRALTNLEDVNHIHVKGPKYIETTVLAKVVPTEPEKADQVELAVLKQLESFLHPLQGGPVRKGWEIGRNVYLSEVYAEIEVVSGVDHVAKVRLLGSVQQHHLRLVEEAGGYREIPFNVPVESQVSSFDERVKLFLAEPLFKGVNGDGPKNGLLRQLDVYGFKVGDKVAIVAANNQVVKNKLTIASLSAQIISFAQPFDPPSEWDQRDALISPDGRLQLPLTSEGILLDKEGKVAGVTVQGFTDGDKISVVSGGKRHPALEFLPIQGVESCEDRVFVPEGHLVYSGSHDIDIVLE